MSQTDTSPSPSASQSIKPKKKAKLLNIQNFNVGLITALIVQPFEVIRTSSITSLKNNNNGLSGTISVIRQIFRMEGLKGFFRGGLMSMGKSTLGAGVFFTGLENVHVLTNELRHIKYLPGNVVDFFNACCSRTITTLVVNPLTVIKTRFEVVGSDDHQSIAGQMKSIYKKAGIQGFYKGILTTIMRDVPYSGLQYSSYRFCMDSWAKYIGPDKNAYDSPLVVSVAGAVSAVFAVLMTYPFDNIRVRVQTHDMNENVGLVKVASDIYRQEGLRGFYLGYLPRLMKKGTSSALSWVVYEKLRKDTVIH